MSGRAKKIAKARDGAEIARILRQAEGRREAVICSVGDSWGGGEDAPFCDTMLEARGPIGKAQGLRPFH